MEFDDIEDSGDAAEPDGSSTISQTHTTDTGIETTSDDDATEPPEICAEHTDAELSLACDAYAENIDKRRINIMQLPETTVDWFRALPEPDVYAKRNPFPQFDKVQFFDEGHYYMVPNPYMNALERCRGSVTSALHVPFEHFDPEEHAKRISGEKRTYGEYAGMEADQIKHMWEFGANSGSAFHKSAELFLNTPLDIPEEVCTSSVYRCVEFDYFVKFVKDQIIGQVDIIRTELRLTDWPKSRKGTWVDSQIRAGKYYTHDPVMQCMLPMVKLAGSADFICHRRSNPDKKAVEIWDWKRSKKIRENSFGNKYGKWPCDAMPDCNLRHYWLQLNFYKWMLENNTDYHVTGMKIVVFHPLNQSYLVYDVPDLQPTVQRLMIQRLKENAKLAPSPLPAREVDYIEFERYSKEIGEWLAAAPRDPTDMWGFATAPPPTTAKRQPPVHGERVIID